MKPMVSLALAIVLSACPSWAQERIEAITRPSEDAVLSFVRPGRVAKVLVKEGEAVKAGQELIRLDDEAERIQLEQLKAQAEDTTRIKAAEAQLAQRKVDLRKTEWALRRLAATEMEVQHAKLDVTISELSLELSQFEHKQAERKYREAKVQVDRMRLRSPIDGKVERVLVEPGESADALEKILQVVKIDPLWIDVAVPLADARRLKRGKANAEVEFEPDGAVRPAPVPGDIIHIATVADAGSGTLTVRVEVANRSQRPAGEHVYVSFPAVRTAMRPGR
jgi:membrane fusion protein (multidrug efflux system)